MNLLGGLIKTGADTEDDGAYYETGSSKAAVGAAAATAELYGRLLRSPSPPTDAEIDNYIAHVRSADQEVAQARAERDARAAERYYGISASSNPSKAAPRISRQRAAAEIMEHRSTPIIGASLGLRPRGKPVVEWISTSAGGGYEFAAVPPGRYEVTTRVGGVVRQLPVTLAPDDYRRQDIYVLPAGVLSTGPL